MRYAKLRKILLTVSIPLLFFGCTEKKYVINISSKYKGWIYILSSSDSITKSELYPDTNGVVYVSNYCKCENSFEIKIDGQAISPATRIHYDKIFSVKNILDSNYRFSYSRFYFPLTGSDISNEIDTGILYKDETLRNFDYLIETNKIDKTRLISCE